MGRGTPPPPFFLEGRDMRDLVSDMERRHRAWGKGFSNKDDFLEEDNGDAIDPHREWVDQQWTNEEYRLVNQMLEKHMEATGESAEWAFGTIIAQLRKKKEEA